MSIGRKPLHILNSHGGLVTR